MWKQKLGVVLMASEGYQDMTLTGRKDEHKGREYACDDCGGVYWTAWGNARRHTCDGGEPPEVRTDGGEPTAPEREEHMADEYHDRFLTAREYLRDGYAPEDAADHAGLDVDAFTGALDGSPEDIRGTNRTTCEGCGERVTPYVRDGGGGYSGDVRTRRGMEGLDISWCSWDDAGIPVDARPEGWREQRPDDGFPCPDCSEELTTDTITSFNTGAPEYRNGVRCGHCGTELGDDGDE